MSKLEGLKIEDTNEKGEKEEKKVEACKYEKNRRPKFNNVYVKDFPAGTKMNLDEFKKLFSTVGEVASAIVQDDKDGNIGFGFLCFKDPESADKLINEGFSYNG